MFESIDNAKVKKYFDELALSWDANNKVDINKLNILFDKGSYFSNASILDIGCGTGILFTYYLLHNAKSITGIDLSSTMISVSKNKYKDVNLICGNAIDYNFSNKFDVIVIYNTLPHIKDIDSLLINCKKHLNSNGKVIIAFGQSQIDTNNIHNNVPANIRTNLMDINELNNICSKYFNVYLSISNDDLYEIICVNKV